MISASQYAFIGLTILLILNIIVAIFLEMKKSKLIHETMIILLFAIAFTKFYTWITDGKLITISLKPDLLFEYVLPPIIFAAGYNMRKKFFFKNVLAIFSYGFFGTILNFFVSTGTFYYVHNYLLNDLGIGAHAPDSYNWKLLTIMKIVVTLGASDTVAPLTTIDEMAYPTMFSIIFGEGICNDAVALILMSTTLHLEKNNFETVNPGIIFDFFLNFSMTAVFSILFGAGMGFVSCLLHRKIQHLKHVPLLECALVLLMAILTYSLCELPQLQLAAIVAIFVFGIIQSHYNKYNLSEESVEKNGFVFGVLSWVCEAFILIYLGLSFDEISVDVDVVTYAGVDFVLIICCRFLTTFVTSGILGLFLKKKKRISI